MTGNQVGGRGQRCLIKAVPSEAKRVLVFYIFASCYFSRSKKKLIYWEESCIFPSVKSPRGRRRGAGPLGEPTGTKQCYATHDRADRQFLRRPDYFKLLPKVNLQPLASDWTAASALPGL